MRIGLDVMGGDYAPREIVRGAVRGLSYLGPDDHLVLYGAQPVIEREAAEAGLNDPRVSIEHCTEVIEMDDSPVEAVRQKRDSSIMRMAAAAGKKQLDAIISAGNTGAFVAAGQLRIRLIEGVSRPGIAVVIPTFHGPVVVCDVGANVAPKPHHLHEYAHMAAMFSRNLLGKTNPRIGLVSIGEEDAKGNSLTKEAHNLIKNDPKLTFVGNMEGRDIFGGEADVFISDGFVGNVVLKLTEGLAEGLFKTIVGEIKEESPELAKGFAPIVDRIWKRHDFAEYGGAPLLGLSTLAIICHGRSDAKAIGNAIRVAVEQNRLQLIEKIAADMSAVAKGA
jgi:glycerol-3-phosphate acyltransferase PlsX